MKTWSIEVAKNFRVPSDKINLLEKLFRGIGGEIVIDDVLWNGTYIVHTEGGQTDSRHVAKRIVDIIHGFGGRVHLREIHTAPLRSRKEGLQYHNNHASIAR